MSDAGEPLRIVIDGTNVLYRSHHALSKSALTHAGRPVWAVHGLIVTAAKLLRENPASHLLVAFDSPGGCPARRVQQPAYKQTRTPPASELLYQLEWAPALLADVGIGVWRLESWEADDGLASAAATATGPVLVVTSDRDALQLVDDRVSVALPDGTRITDPYVQAKYGVPARLYPHLAALRGEPSDNLPGVAGVGEKGAANLLARFESIDGVFAATDAELRTVVGPKAIESIRRDEHQARTTFAVGCLHAGLPVDWDSARLSRLHPDSLRRGLAHAGLPKAGENLADVLEPKS